jgi:2-polyprenyl-3-methyl-5-hydroxy-6-metoxy-1,4-benzoquinol methylase
VSQLANKSPHHNLELHCDYDNESTLSNYGYCDNKASCAHDYLLPRLMQELHKLSQGRLLKVVDLGCGNGYVAWRIAEQGHSVTGIDVSSDGIEIARASFPLISYHPVQSMTLTCSRRLEGRSIAWSLSKLSSTCFIRRGFSSRAARYW